jgi:hypothetical protein
MNSDLENIRNQFVRHSRAIFVPIDAVLVFAAQFIAQDSVQQQQRQKDGVSVGNDVHFACRIRCEEANEDFRNVMEMCRDAPPA